MSDEEMMPGNLASGLVKRLPQEMPGQMMAIAMEALSNEEDAVHPETVISALAAMAGEFALLAVGPQTAAAQPGQRISSNKVQAFMAENTRQLTVFALFAQCLQGLNIPIEKNEWAPVIPPQHMPQHNPLESAAKLRPAMLALMEDADLVGKDRALAAVVGAAVAIEQLQQAVPHAVGKAIAVTSMIHTSQTGPLPSVVMS